MSGGLQRLASGIHRVHIILGLLCNVVFNIMLDQALPGLVLQVVDILAGAFLLCSLLQAGMALVGRTEALTQEKPKDVASMLLDTTLAEIDESAPRPR